MVWNYFQFFSDWSIHQITQLVFILMLHMTLEEFHFQKRRQTFIGEGEQSCHRYLRTLYTPDCL